MDVTETYTDGSGERPKMRHKVIAPGTDLGRFRIDRALGQGGFGSVYEAFDHGLQRSVALKLLVATGQDEGSALIREARALARVSHPSLANVIDVVDVDGQVGLVMELVAGRTLSEWIGEVQPSWDRVVEVIATVADALAAAHGAGLIHRDVKPNNIVMDGSGRPIVVDFGLAVHADTASLAVDLDEDEVSHPHVDPTRASGTPAYMSPEQMRGGRLDARTDQYALGIVLLEALTRTRPFLHVTPAHLYGEKQKQPSFQIPPPAPSSLRRVIVRCLSPVASDRFPYLAELSIALRQIVRAAETERRLQHLVTLGATVWGALAVFGIFSTSRLTGIVATAFCVLTLVAVLVSARLGRRGHMVRARFYVLVPFINFIPLALTWSIAQDHGPVAALSSWTPPFVYSLIIMMSTLLQRPRLSLLLGIQSAALSFAYWAWTDIGAATDVVTGAPVQIYRSLQLIALGVVAAGLSWLTAGAASEIVDE